VLFIIIIIIIIITHECDTLHHINLFNSTNVMYIYILGRRVIFIIPGFWHGMYHRSQARICMHEFVVILTFLMIFVRNYSVC